MANGAIMGTRLSRCEHRRQRDWRVVGYVSSLQSVLLFVESLAVGWKFFNSYSTRGLWFMERRSTKNNCAIMLDDVEVTSLELTSVLATAALESLSKAEDMWKSLDMNWPQIPIG
ncbi:hypothetical protein M422DRAFT_40974 [Sphaerobolus stellatus SS14]|nr:hypothetical protein M422DRAFT_40974 [Sphaerobolus stellatus SS14]